MKKTLLQKYDWDTSKQTIEIAGLDAKKHINWPEESNRLHIAIATALWDFENDAFQSNYSDEITISDEAEIQNITINTIKPLGKGIYITYLFIGFGKQDRKKYKRLHRKFNTATIIDVSQIA